MFRINRFAVVLAISVISISASAQNYIGPQASGMGGAGRAAIVPGESAFLNPASAAYFGEYFATGFYSQSSHPASGENQEFGILLSDGAPDRLFQGALSYKHGNINPLGGGDYTTQDIYGTAAALVRNNVSFGFSAHRFSFKRNGGATTTQWNGGAGLIYVYSKVLQFGLVANDILKPAASVPVAWRLGKTFGAGMSVNFDELFKYRLDFAHPSDNNPDSNTDVMTGIESEVARFMAFRLGFRWNESQGPERRVFTAGIGFKGPKLRADYGFEKDTKVAGGIRHSFDLWMPF